MALHHDHDPDPPRVLLDLSSSSSDHDGDGDGVDGVGSVLSGDVLFVARCHFLPSQLRCGSCVILIMDHCGNDCSPHRIGIGIM